LLEVFGDDFPLEGSLLFRGEDSGRSTIDALREIIGTVRPRAGESSTADFSAAPTWLT